MIIKKVIESVFVCFLFVWREERTNETKKNWEEITLASPLSGHHEMTIDDHPIWLLCPSPNAGNRRRISLIKHLFAWILGRITQYTLARRGEKGDSRRDYHRTDPDISSFFAPFLFSIVDGDWLHPKMTRLKRDRTMDRNDTEMMESYRDGIYERF